MSTTKYVTISVGGNDAGFSGVITECAQPGWSRNCNGAIDGAQSFINNTLPGRLNTLYASIKSRAPSAVVVVAGYPRIFKGEDCNAATWFSPVRGDPAQPDRRPAQRQAVGRGRRRKGFKFANPTSRFIGHAVCDDVEWLNGLSNPISESYHPNKLGQSSGYTPLVSPLLVGAPGRDGSRDGR